MAKMYCSTKVKYNGTSFPPYTPFEVAEADVEKLLTLKEAWLVKEAATSNQEPLEEKEEKPKKARRAKKEAK